MTTYRLPDGTEIASLDVSGGPGSQAWITHPTLGQIVIGRDKLTEVKPPLPLEPPNGTVFSNEADAIIRCDDEHDPEGRWETTGSGTYRRWHEVAPVVTKPGWRRYRPDPADDAFELPWRGDGDTIEVSQDAPGDDTPIWVEIKPSWRTPLEARQKAALLLRAAREVEKP